LPAQPCPQQKEFLRLGGAGGWGAKRVCKAAGRVHSKNFCNFPNIIVGNYAGNLSLSREMAIKQSNLQQRRLVQIVADKSMQNGSLHYFFSYLTDFDVVMRKLISE
jgi:hypothetical protein